MANVTVKADHKEGDRVRLGYGWWLTFCVVDRNGEDYVQGFVEGHGGSASLCYAISNGTTSNENERQIPAEVLRTLEPYEEIYG